EVLEEVGRGGFGVVYRARHAGLGRVVALKVLKPGARASAAERGRFLAEARAAARLNHPHVATVHEVGEAADGAPYFALEGAGGASLPRERPGGGRLARRLAGPPWPARPAAALVERLARAVQHAHEYGVLHRDLKPANVLLADDSLAHPKIADFGLAKFEDGG